MPIDLESLPPIGGLHIHYYFLCKRKLWFYANKISLENESEDVKIGRLIHETFYPREGKNILIGDAMVDILSTSKDTIVVEIKKSSKEIKPVMFQLYYYLYIIERTGTKPRGILKIPNEKKAIELALTPEIKKQVETVIEEVIKIIQMEKPPPPIRKKECKKCAYKDLCFI